MSEPRQNLSYLIPGELYKSSITLFARPVLEQKPIYLSNAAVCLHKNKDQLLYLGHKMVAEYWIQPAVSELYKTIRSTTYVDNDGHIRKIYLLKAEAKMTYVYFLYAGSNKTQIVTKELPMIPSQTFLRTSK